MLERNPNLKASQVIEILAKTATRLPTMPVGIKNISGYGMLWLGQCICSCNESN